MFEVQYYPLAPYQEMWEQQKDWVKKIDRREANNQLILLQHPHTITLGRGSHPENLLLTPKAYAERGIEVVEIDRGGDVTYHGPGQLVGYPIFFLGEGNYDSHRYLRLLEEGLIQVLKNWGIQAGRKEGYTGVWVGDEKIAAIGVKFNRSRNRRGYITSHGFSLNVHPDLRFFETIIPCGIQEYAVTSMERVLGTTVSLSDVARKVVEEMKQVFAKI